MNGQNKILYEHLKDYPTSSEAYHKIGNRAVPAAWAHKPEITEASPGKRSKSAVGTTQNKPKPHSARGARRYGNRRSTIGPRH